MEITTTRGPVTLISVSGPIDASNFSEVVKAADEALEEGSVQLVLDLSGVQYISSSGLAALQTIGGRCAARGGRAVLCSVQPPVMRVLELTAFTRLLSVFTDCQSAQASFNEA